MNHSIPVDAKGDHIGWLTHCGKHVASLGKSEHISNKDVTCPKCKERMSA